MIPLRRTAERPESDAYDRPAARASTLTLDQPRPAGGMDARKLQDRARAFAAGETALPGTQPDKWTTRRTLAFAVGASLLLWGGIFMMGWAVLRSFS